MQEKFLLENVNRDREGALTEVVMDAIVSRAWVDRLSVLVALLLIIHDLKCFSLWHCVSESRVLLPAT